VGLREKADARPAELSGGEQQRIAVCAAVAHRPRLLLADEPTGELDAENAGIVYDLVAALARESKSTVVIVSHDPTSARIADRAVSIRDGRVSEEASSRNFGDESIVVGRGGWLRLPEDLLARAGISTRAVATLVEQGARPAVEIQGRTSQAQLLDQTVIFRNRRCPPRRFETVGNKPDACFRRT